MPRSFRLVFRSNRCLSGTAFLTGLGVIGILALATAQQAPRKVTPSPKDLECSKNLKQLALASLLYAQDHDDLLPPLDTAARFQKAMLSYTGNDKSLFKCPVTGIPYVPNAAFSGKPEPSVGHPWDTIMVRDAKPHPIGFWFVVYMDGHVRGVKSLPKAGGKKK